MFPQLPADLSSLSAEELAALIDEFVAMFNEVAADTNVSDEQVAELSEAANAIDTLRAEKGTRDQAAAERANQIASLADRVNLSTEEGEGEHVEGDDNGGTGEGEGQTGEGEQGAEGGEAQPAAGADGSAAAGEGQGGVGDGAGSVTAGATLATLQRNAPARTRPRPQGPADPSDGMSITAAAGIPNVNAGAKVKNLREAATLMLARQRNLGRGTDGDDVPVIQFNLDMERDRRLGRETDVLEQIKKFNTAPDAITAAGGLCAPVDNYYNQAVIAQAARPVRDALANFTADRGGIRFNPPPQMASITSGVGTVTAAQDGSNATKSCFTVTCPSIQEVDITAIYNCLTFGNFGARTFPEQVEAWTELALAVQARLAESYLLNGISLASTTVTTGSNVGAGRELFARYGQVAAAYRSRNRMAPDALLQVFLPAWSLDLVQADFSRSFTDTPGLISMSQNDVKALFGDRNLAPTFYLDSKTGGGQILGGPAGGQTYYDGATTASSTTVTSATAGFTSADVGLTITGGSIPAGATISSVTNATTVVISAAATGTATGVTLTVGRPVALEFPTTVDGFMFPAGSFLHLDGGTLDLGLVRDSTLNTTNQFRMFSETFENVAFVGVQSLEIISTLNADGSYAAARSVALPINN